MYRISNRSQFIMRAKLTSRRANEARFLARERTANTCPVCRTHRQGEEADIVRPDNEVAISLKDNERTPPFENYTKTQNTRGCGNWLEASPFHLTEAPVAFLHETFIFVLCRGRNREIDKKLTG